MNPCTIMKSLEHKEERLCVRKTESIAARVLNSSNCARE